MLSHDKLPSAACLLLFLLWFLLVCGACRYNRLRGAFCVSTGNFHLGSLELVQVVVNW